MTRDLAIVTTWLEQGQGGLVSYPWIVACLVTAGVFAASVHGAVRSPENRSEFVGSVVALARRPRPVARRLAVVVVVAESAVVLGTGAALLLASAGGAARAPAGALAAAAGTGGAALLLVLAAALRRALREQPGARCHCFGAGDEVATRHVVRNLVLAAVALVPVVDLLLPAPDPPRPAGALLCAVVATVAVEAVRRLDDVAGLLALPRA